MDARKLVGFVVVILAAFVAAALLVAGLKLGWFEFLRLPGTKKPEVTKVKLDPQATATCRAYLKKVDSAAARYARANRGKPYPWADYADMIDNAPPSLVPKYLLVVRGCPDGGNYTWDAAGRTVQCSISEHNP